MTRKQGLLPNEYVKRSVVSAPAQTVTGVLGDQLQYVVETRRLDGAWRVSIQYIDPTGQGHQVALPHSVVERLAQQRQAIIREGRSKQAKQRITALMAAGYRPSFIPQVAKEEKR